MKTRPPRPRLERAVENRDLRVGGQYGFERSYALSAAAGEHDPATIRILALKLRTSLRQPGPFLSRMQHSSPFAKMFCARKEHYGKEES